MISHEKLLTAKLLLIECHDSVPEIMAVLAKLAAENKIHLATLIHLVILYYKNNNELIKYKVYDAVAAKLTCDQYREYAKYKFNIYLNDEKLAAKLEDACYGYSNNSTSYYSIRFMLILHKLASRNEYFMMNICNNEYLYMLRTTDNVYLLFPDTHKKDVDLINKRKDQGINYKTHPTRTCKVCGLKRMVSEESQKRGGDELSSITWRCINCRPYL